LARTEVRFIVYQSAVSLNNAARRQIWRRAALNWAAGGVQLSGGRRNPCFYSLAT